MKGSISIIIALLFLVGVFFGCGWLINSLLHGLEGTTLVVMRIVLWLILFSPTASVGVYSGYMLGLFLYSKLDK